MPSKWCPKRSRRFAWQFLYELFELHYRPLPATRILHAARRAGIRESAIRRAKAQLDMRAFQVYRNGCNEWFWLPPFLMIADGRPEEWDVPDPPLIRADTDLAEYIETTRLIMPNVGSIESYRLIEEVLNEEFEARERWSKDVWRLLALAGPLQTVGVNYPGCLSAKLNARRIKEEKNPIRPKPFSKEFPIDPETDARIKRRICDWHDRYRMKDSLPKVLHRMRQLYETTADWSLLEKQMHWLSKAPEASLELPQAPWMQTCDSAALEPAPVGPAISTHAPKPPFPAMAALEPGSI